MLKTPFIAAFKQLYPHATLDVVVGNTFGIEYLTEHNPHIRQTLHLPIKATWATKLAFFRNLRREQYDVLFLPFDAQPNFLLWGSYLAGIKRIIRHQPRTTTASGRLKSNVPTYFVPTTNVPLLPAYHEIDKNFDLLDALHQQPFARTHQTEVYFQPDETVLSAFGLASQAYIVIQPGAANGNYLVKAWRTERFAQLIKQLQAAYPTHQLVLVGDKGDLQASVKPLLQQLPSNFPLVNTAGQTTINQLVNLLAQAALVICHDSGIMHLANALNVPLIALYGPTDYIRTRPLRQNRTSYCRKPLIRPWPTTLPLPKPNWWRRALATRRWMALQWRW